jgi:hypothetical protein
MWPLPEVGLALGDWVADAETLVGETTTLVKVEAAEAEAIMVLLAKPPAPGAWVAGAAGLEVRELAP